MNGESVCFVFWQEHDCVLTQNIVELIDRETDLLIRSVKEVNLEGLRKRIATLLLQYIKTPSFNPQVTKRLKVSAHLGLLQCSHNTQLFGDLVEAFYTSSILRSFCQPNTVSNIVKINM